MSLLPFAIICIGITGFETDSRINSSNIITHKGGCGIKKTVRWYLGNGEWLDNVTSGEYKEYYDKHYGKETLQKQD